MSQLQENATEEWRPVVGFEGLYEVSNLGRIKRSSASYRKKPGDLVKTPFDGKYLRCNLWRDGKCRSVLLHRVVAAAFLGMPGPTDQVNHIDGNKLNNRIENLEWTSPSGNIQHALRFGLKDSGETHEFAKLTEADIRDIRCALDRGVSGAELARKYGVTKSNISCIKHGRSWRFFAA
jgi:hypothetical protein